jgi:hypothetical protein
MGDSGRSSEDQNADRNADSKDCVHQVSGENEGCVGNSTAGHLSYSLAKNLTILFPWPATLKGPEFKGDGLSTQVEEILRQFRTQPVALVFAG